MLEGRLQSPCQMVLRTGYRPTGSAPAPSQTRPYCNPAQRWYMISQCVSHGGCTRYKLIIRIIYSSNTTRCSMVFKNFS
jgi:hypothetical protein